MAWECAELWQNRFEEYFAHGAELISRKQAAQRVRESPARACRRSVGSRMVVSRSVDTGCGKEPQGSKLGQGASGRSEGKRMEKCFAIVVKMDHRLRLFGRNWRNAGPRS